MWPAPLGRVATSFADETVVEVVKSVPRALLTALGAGQEAVLMAAAGVGVGVGVAAGVAVAVAAAELLDGDEEEPPQAVTAAAAIRPASSNGIGEPRYDMAGNPLTPDPTGSAPRKQTKGTEARWRAPEPEGIAARGFGYPTAGTLQRWPSPGTGACQQVRERWAAALMSRRLRGLRDSRVPARREGASAMVVSLSLSAGRCLSPENDTGSAPCTPRLGKAVVGE
jgi:hypothetical protein